MPYFSYTKTQITPVNPEVSLHPDHIGGLRLAVASYSGIETKFGLCLPKFNAAPRKPIKAERAAPAPAPVTQPSPVTADPTISKPDAVQAQTVTTENVAEG